MGFILTTSKIKNSDNSQFINRPCMLTMDRDVFSENFFEKQVGTGKVFLDKVYKGWAEQFLRAGQEVNENCSEFFL